jgi:hypothetical protein
MSPFVVPSLFELRGLRRALLLLGWGLLIANLVVAWETQLRDRANAPISLSSRLVDRLGIKTNTRSLEDDAVATGFDIPETDELGRPRFVSGQLIIRFQDHIEKSSVETILGRHGVRILDCLNPVRRLYLIETPAATDLRALATELRRAPEIEYAVPNLLEYTAAPAAPAVRAAL